MKTNIKSGTPEWLEARRTMVTATDWPVLLLPPEKRPGWMARKSPLGIWSRIKGLEPPEETVGSVGEWGLYMEHAAAPWLEDLTGLRIIREDVLWVADDGPGAGSWMGCTLDGTAVDGDSEGTWECKGPRAADDWEAEGGGHQVPGYVQIQMQAQMACVRRGWGMASCLCWPHHYYGRVERNDRFIAWAREKIGAWWETYVVGDIPPEPEGTDGDARLLSAMHDPSQDVVVMDPKIEELCAQIEVVDADLAVKEARSKALKNALRAWMREQGAERTVDAARTTAWLFSKKAGLRRVKP